MKKNKALILFLLLGLVLTLSACGKTELASPEISLDETIVSWDDIENATGFKVKVNDKEYAVNGLSYDLKDLEELSYEITVIAVGDGKKILDSKPSNKITVTPANKVEFVKGNVEDEKHEYKLKVQSNAGVLGFTFKISYPADKLTFNADKVTWKSVVPIEWIYDINEKDGVINIAITGLEPINVRLLQTLLTLEFTVVDATASATLDAFEIDNG
jgi:hypothetical protein